MAGLEAFKILALSRFTDADFKIITPTNAYLLISPAEFSAMCNELLTVDSKPYLATYENALRVKFSDYSVALVNKEQALALSKQESETAAQKIQSEKLNADTAAKLQSVAIDPVVSTTTRALKKSYAIDMPETIQSVIAIMTAFTANIDKCLPKLNVNKWFAFTPAQAGTALAKVKCDDNDFAPAGVIFKSVDKL